MSTIESRGSAAVNVSRYLRDGIEAIDELLGDGYAETHPELLGAFIRACSVESSIEALTEEIGAGLDDVARQLATIGSSILTMG